MKQEIRKGKFLELITIFFYLLIISGFFKNVHAAQILDFEGVTTADQQGNQKTEFSPGESIRYEAKFSLQTPGIAILRGNVTGENWSDILSPRVRIGRRGEYSVSWMGTIPPDASGKAKVDIILLKPLQERLIRTAVFTIQPIEAEFVGSDVCAVCHRDIFDAWETTRHAPAIGCESCHGPASEHVLTQSPQFIIVDTTSELCGRCHARNDGSTIEARDGFIKNLQQFNEWRATAHGRAIECTTCHNPHFSPSLQRTEAIKAECIACHADKTVSLNMQELACEDCHMPFAVLRSQSDGAGLYREGDVPSHIWRIKTEADPEEMFTADGSALAQDEQGAFLTVNFSCLNCHDGVEERLEDFEAVRQTSTLIH